MPTDDAGSPSTPSSTKDAPRRAAFAAALEEGAA